MPAKTGRHGSTPKKAAIRAAWPISCKSSSRSSRPDQCWSLTYATTCSKPRLGEFGGGAVFVTADNIRWNNSYDFVAEQRNAFERHLQHDRRLIGKAAELGIEPEQLDEAVHEAASAAAASINNAGVDDQIVYLIEHCGAEETEKILNKLSGTGQEHDHE